MNGRTVDGVAKAKVTLVSGTTVVVEGTPAEVEDVLRRLEGNTTPAPAPAEAPRSPTSKGTGPRAWLDDLVAEGFFNEPRGQRQILDVLAEGGHHLKDSDITRQLQTMTRDRVLRRKKAPIGVDGRPVWGYSKW